MKTNYENTGMLDMVFENRNKTYGAYALRSDYNQRISRALIVSTSVVFLLCFGKLLSDKMKYNAVKVEEGETILKFVEPPIIDPTPKPKILPPVVQQSAQGVSTIENPEMMVTADNNTQDTASETEQLQNYESGLTTNITGNAIGVTDGHGTEAVFAEAAHEAIVETTIHTTVEEMPEYPGGEQAMMKFLIDNTEYPRMERDNDMNGKVLLRFVVNEDGSISQVTSLRETTKGFANEAKRVVALMPKFKPGRQQGRAVKVQFILPMQFTLGR